MHVRSVVYSVRGEGEMFFAEERHGWKTKGDACEKIESERHIEIRDDVISFHPYPWAPI